jgi:peptidoglycan L-alanyl-D-glutamate endopeptidase CwlK
MSDRLFPDDVLFTQRLLSCCGLYSYKLDGIWGSRTDAAVAQFEDRSKQIATEGPDFDPRSELNISSLDLRAQPVARQSLARIRESGLDARIISGARTYAEQAALYAQGRFGNPGKIVTNANAGQSWHNFGLAWDIGIFDKGKYLDEGEEYDHAGELGKVPDVQWGGDWHGFKDKPHFELPLGASTIQIARQRFECGGRQ